MFSCRFSFCGLRCCPCGCFPTLFLSFFFNRNCFLELNGNFYIFFGNIANRVAIYTDSCPFTVLTDHLKTLIFRNQCKYCTFCILFLAHFQSLSCYCRPLGAKLINQLLCAVADRQIIFHYITTDRTGFDIYPVTLGFHNRSCTAPVQFTDNRSLCTWFLTDIHIVCRDGYSHVRIFRLRFWCR